MLRSAAAPQATLQKREVNHVNTKAGQPYHCKDSGPEAMRTRDRPSSAARNPETFACLRPSGMAEFALCHIAASDNTDIPVNYYYRILGICDNKNSSISP